MRSSASIARTRSNRLDASRTASAVGLRRMLTVPRRSAVPTPSIRFDSKISRERALMPNRPRSSLTMRSLAAFACSVSSAAWVSVLLTSGMESASSGIEYGEPLRQSSMNSGCKQLSMVTRPPVGSILDHCSSGKQSERPSDRSPGPNRPTLCWTIRAAASVTGARCGPPIPGSAER